MNYIKIILAAIGRFLKFAFASQITIGVFAVVYLLAGKTLLGLLILVWAIVLTVSEYKQR